MKRDIKNRKDIEKLVNAFYNTIKSDVIIGFLFTDVANVNWEKHLPIMYDFWENILFSTGNYNGSPIEVHKAIHKKSEMKSLHFEHWNTLFVASVDQLFEGPKADEIKKRALNISVVLMHNTLT
jgi:hemoglobin